MYASKQERPVFIRHKMCIQGSRLQDFFNNRLIAIHFNDRRSWTVGDYSGSGAQAIRLFNKIDVDGGWILADYSRLSQDKTILIGKVKVGSKHFVQAQAECHRKHGPGLSPIHEYKVIVLEEAKEFSPIEYPLLRLPLGQGTVHRTKVIKYDALIAMYKGESLPPTVDSLHSTQLELICHEYLRRFYDPKLQYLLDNIGGQLKDVDIIGGDANGGKILAQVSHIIEEGKLAALQKHKGRQRILLYFGPDQNADTARRDYPDVQYMIINQVFDRMRKCAATCMMIEHFLAPQGIP